MSTALRLFGLLDILKNNGFADGIAENLPETLLEFVASGQEIALIAELCAAADDGIRCRQVFSSIPTG